LTPLSYGMDLRKWYENGIVLAQGARFNDGNYWAGLGAWLKPKGDWVMHRKVKKLRDISELLRTLCNDKKDTRCNECRRFGRYVCILLKRQKNFPTTGKLSYRQ
jgi:hypothetical protein